MEEEVVNDAEIEESPVVEEEPDKTLTFGEAINEALTGKRMQRKAWPEDEYGHFEGDFLHIFKDGKDFSWTVSKGDVVEADYIAW
jgi:hypothetical protein